MRITYDPGYDVLYIKLNEGFEKVTTKEVSEDISLDFGEKEQIVGIEILAASQHLALSSILPARFEKSAVKV
ncbi:DUF2283 domain-containing protein [candidate division WOR-3 bacterium]|nr:DUF2283 domain-containing protein [candidate division WOR-3 bacterium]